jgi:hypothetical protein
MPTESGDPARNERALEEAVDEALAAFPDEDRAAAIEAVDYRWLSVGMRLGLERPEQARHLLELIGDVRADRAVPGVAEPGDGSPVGPPATDGPGGSATVPVRSSLLARAAALPPSERATIGPEVTFGWAARLTPDEIRSLGRVVHDMLAAGSPPDIGRGFGLAWDAGVRLPRHEVDAMFKEFTELEVTVGGVLAGRDLRLAGQPAPRPRGLGAIFDPWSRRARPGESQAAAALETSGEPGRRGLVALWNVWVAMRFRTLIPRPTFELLVHPWVTVVGPLPEP